MAFATPTGVYVVCLLVLQIYQRSMDSTQIQGHNMTLQDLQEHVHDALEFAVSVHMMNFTIMTSSALTTYYDMLSQMCE